MGVRSCIKCSKLKSFKDLLISLKKLTRNSFLVLNDSASQETNLLLESGLFVK